MSGRRAGRLGVILLGVLAATACSSAVPGTAGPVAPVPPGLERFYAQQLAWGPCTPFARGEDEKKAFAGTALECARLEVPLDYAAPTGRTARIAVLRHRTDRPRVGSLVLNPGGPGGAGLAFAASMAGPYGDGPFDVVGFDPRGVGASTPALDCLTPAEDREQREKADDPSARGAVAVEALNREYVRKCEERSGGDEVLANVGTRDVARDLDVLRAALGDRTLTYVGYSYGTRIGATYAEMFPRNVRAMVLDGAIDPAQTAADSRVAQMAGFQHAFDAYAADCAHRPGCPLTGDPTATYQALVRPLLAAPLRVAGGRSLSYGDATTGTIAALYNPGAWPSLTAALAALKAGDGAPLLQLADGYHDAADDDAFTAINCVDRDRTTDRAAAAEIDRRATAAAPFLDSGLPPVAALDVCGLWPVPPTSTPHRPRAEGLPPTLVISTTGDPATPYAAGVTLADALHARLLTVEGTQHGAAGEGYRCVDGIVADYLADLALPADGARCVIPAGTSKGA